MAKTIEELQTERRAVISRQQAILEKAKAGKRNLTADEAKAFEDLNGQFDDLTEEIRYQAEHRDRPKREPIKPSTYEGQKKLTEKDMAEIRRAIKVKGTHRMIDETEYRYNPQSREHRDLMNSYFLHGPHALNETEYRALQSDLDTAGGFLVLPESMAREFIKAKDNFVVMRKLAKQYFMENATSLKFPALDTRMAVPTWTAEIATGTEDSSMDFDGRAISPHPLAKRIKVSEKLLRIATPNPEIIVRDEMAYQFGITEDNAFLNGSGQNQPLGIFTASAHGIDTGRDYTTEVTATVKADDLIEVVGNQKAQYRTGSAWIMSRALETRIRKLKDGEGNYLLINSLVQGQPNMLLGYPVYVSEYCPQTFTSGQYVGIFGDFSYYVIVDALRMRIQRLTELYAEAGQVGFIGRMEVDGMPILSEAFTRIKLK